MKHGRFIAIGSACALLAPGAYAQSAVTLYGIIDAGVSYTNNVKGGSLWQERVYRGCWKRGRQSLYPQGEREARMA